MAPKVGDVAPDFKLPCVIGNQEGRFQLSAFRGKNVVLMFYPLDFTPVCASELPAFQADLDQFEALNAQLLAISTDSVACHMAFQESLGGLKYPLASDRWPYAETAKAYGIFPAAEAPHLGVNERAIFIVDKNGKLAWSKVYDLDDQPESSDILQVLRELP